MLSELAHSFLTDLALIEMLSIPGAGCGLLAVKQGDELPVSHV
jgi:hypothetical protein